MTSIDIEDNQIMTHGQTNSIAVIIAYVTALEEPDYYSKFRIADVYVDDTSDPLKNMGNYVTFTVVMTR